MKLKEMLDRDGYKRNSTEEVKIIQGTRAMRATRNYLEHEPWNRLLDLNVIQNNGSIYVVENI